MNFRAGKNESAGTAIDNTPSVFKLIFLHQALLLAMLSKKIQLYNFFLTIAR